MRRALIAIALFFGLLAPAHAQLAANCPTYNTTEFTHGNATVLSNCFITSGPYDTILVTVTAEVTCGPLSDAAITLIAGTPPSSTGASFTGSITGGVLTITSMTTPFPEFTVATGQMVFDSNSGSVIPVVTTTCNGVSCKGSSVKITGQLDGTTGGIGHYSVSDATITVGSEPMWALNVSAPLGKPVSTLQIREILEDLNCRNGSTGIVTMQGIVRSNSFIPNAHVWIAIMLTSESISGPDPQGSSWNNGQISMITLGTVGVRGPFGIVQ